jgi:Predicted ATPase
MIGNIIEVLGNRVRVNLAIDITGQNNFLGVHVIFEDNDKKIVGEIVFLDKKECHINIVGEIVGDKFISGINDRPAFKSKVRIITMPELEIILGKQEKTKDKTFFGLSTVYKNYKINVDTNSFFSNHFAIFGNSGSGKSCTFAKIIQSVFDNSENPPIKSRFIIFDAYGEYIKAFSHINTINSKLSTKVITTDIKDTNNELLQIPVWLLDIDDIALLLNADRVEQLPIIEKALKLAPIFKSENEEIIQLKNDIIARALIDIVRSGKESTIIRDQLVAVLSTYFTKDLNLNSEIHQPGYVRTFKQCLQIDAMGKMADIEIVVSFLNSFINDTFKIPDPDGSIVYNLVDLKSALDFALISEGILKSEKIFDYANVLSVRLNSLANSEYGKYFQISDKMSKEEYISYLFLNKENRLAQILDVNINYVDDRLGKVIAKIISRMVFNVLVKSPIRGANPIHIVIEEAHRYVQEDNDLKLLGYNIFDRITKEGRKYGTILGLITQRPSELTDTSVSQCANFIILKIQHPKDLEYVANMVPNISQEGINQVKNLPAGTSLAFGSAFPLSINIKFPLASPEPLSNNSDIVKIWYSN